MKKTILALRISYARNSYGHGTHSQQPLAYLECDVQDVLDDFERGLCITHTLQKVVLQILGRDFVLKLSKPFVVCGTY